MSSALLLTSLLMGGGDISEELSEVAAIPSYDCKADMVFRDKRQNLLWQDQPFKDSENGAFKRNKSIGKAGNYYHAVRYCKHLRYAGYSDWRLPTSNELTNVHNLYGTQFSYLEDNDFWSSTPAQEGKYYAVFPADAIRYSRSVKTSNYIRCVRCTKER